MFTVTVESGFYAWHLLSLSDGSKEDMHAHQWQVSASVSSATLDSTGLVVDFRRLKASLDKIIEPFNEIKLNDIDYFKRNNPSAEAVAKYIYDELQAVLHSEATLESVSVVEEAGCSAKFTK